ncbi:MAG: Holliday junction resolvase RuvX [Thermoanaerobaculales bacterium]|nr:Holliday junction resolvase RuvX [Thermoanaerobaculales bacterium]
MRYLGVDPGGKRMGLAIGDDTTGVASPLEIVPYEGVDRAAQQIAALASKVGAARVVLGLPSLEDGSRGPASRRTERLAEALEALGVEVALQSEFLSTDEARRRARAAGRPPRQPVDDIAAQVLLEEHLTSRSAARPAEG